MQGFTIDQPGQNNLYVNIVDDIQQVAENIGTDTTYQKFGSEINTMSDRDVAKVKTLNFMNVVDLLYLVITNFHQLKKFLQSQKITLRPLI